MHLQQVLIHKKFLVPVNLLQLTIQSNSRWELNVLYSELIIYLKLTHSSIYPPRIIIFYHKLVCLAYNVLFKYHIHTANPETIIGLNSSVISHTGTERIKKWCQRRLDSRN